MRDRGAFEVGPHEVHYDVQCSTGKVQPSHFASALLFSDPISLSEIPDLY